VDTLFLIPTGSLQVRDPATGKPLPPEGAIKPNISYWQRRLRDRDVVVGTPPKAALAAKPAANATATDTAKGDPK